MPLAEARTCLTGMPVRRTTSPLLKPVPATIVVGMDSGLIVRRALLGADGAWTDFSGAGGRNRLGTRTEERHASEVHEERKQEHHG